MILNRANHSSVAAIAAALLVVTVGTVHGQTTQPASQPSSQPGSRPVPATAPDLDERNRKPTLVEQIAAAHNQKAWGEHEAVSFRMNMKFGEKLKMVADITYDYHGNRVRMEIAGGPTVVFDGETAWLSPSDAEFPMARFHVLTWPYFFAAPFKLDDPGAHVVELGVRTQQGKPHYAAKMTFGDGVGDSPDDWYILYANPAGHQLRAMSYIVTYGGTDVETAEKECHAITYDKFGIFNGVVLATKWEFFNWNEEEGIHGDPLGNATLSNVRFVEPADDLFVKPADAREDAMPGEDSNKTE